jgi:hypothetical protein
VLITKYQAVLKLAGKVFLRALTLQQVDIDCVIDAGTATTLAGVAIGVE